MTIVLKRSHIRIAFYVLIGACVFFLLRINEEPARIPALDTGVNPTILEHIQAKSLYVYDIADHQALFARSADRQLPLASVTKLMTALVASDRLASTTIISITREDLAQEGDSKLLLGETWKLPDLLNFSLISSSNDGMHAIARTLNAVYATSTIALMNAEAKQLGLTDTFFVNETGLDIDTFVSGAYSSAHDAALLLAHILIAHPDIVLRTAEPAALFISESGIKHIAVNTDKLIARIPNLIASKTGFTDLAGGNLVIAYDAGFAHPVVIAVLGSTENGRFSDVDLLITESLKKLSTTTPLR